MPVLRLQQPCAPRGDRRAALRARVCRRDRRTAARVPGRAVSTIFFGGGTPSLMQPETVAAILKQSRGTGPSRPMPKSRSKPIRPASKPRASAAIARRASTACRSACRRSTIARWPNWDGCTRRAKRSTPSPSRAAPSTRVSFDLIYARPQQTPQDWASELTRALAEARRASLALSADHRAGHAVCRLACGRQAQNSRR